MWTHFFDMHSGGGCKEEPYEHIFIEAPQKEAELIFYNRFGHHPHRITCSCCGKDYSIYQSNSLSQATGYHRHCKSEIQEDGTYEYVEEPSSFYELTDLISLENFVKREDVLVIYEQDISSEEREGELPEPGGWVWRD